MLVRYTCTESDHHIPATVHFNGAMGNVTRRQVDVICPDCGAPTDAEVIAE